MASPPPALRRRVAWSEEPDRVCLIPTLAELPIEDIWFASTDFFDMKAKTRTDAKLWRQRGFGLLLENTFEQPAPNTQALLNAFCRFESDLCRRGIERQCNRKHGEERADLKDGARYAVLSNQRKLRRRGVQGNELGDEIALQYHEATRAAKLFARRLAKADAHAAAHACDNSPAFELLSAQGVNPHGHGKLERRMSNMSVCSTGTQDSLAYRAPMREGHDHDRYYQQSDSTLSKMPTRLQAKYPQQLTPTRKDECYAAMA